LNGSRVIEILIGCLALSCSSITQIHFGSRECKVATRPAISNKSSNTPEKPSKYPGAGSIRICTVARFTILSSKQNLTVLNTHLDDSSDDQRKLGASMILIRAKYECFREGSNNAVIVTGDFNRYAA
jgi:endonuclease/exonuclease/phosphatase family metal-dependent hydrolase